MSDTLDAVMQAAERLRRALDATCVDLENMPVEAEVDLLRLARFALSILPKGKRPVAIEPAVGLSGFTFDDESVGPEILPIRFVEDGWSREPRPEVFDKDYWIGQEAGWWKAYRTEADAKLAIQWGAFDRLKAAFAS